MNAKKFGTPYVTDQCSGEVLPGTALETWVFLENSPRDLLDQVVHWVKPEGEFRSGIVALKLKEKGKEGSTLFVKEFGLSRKFGRVKASLGRYRALRVWKISWLLFNHGIHVPKPFGYFVYDKKENWGKSYFCCEFLENGRNLSDFAVNSRDNFKEWASQKLLSKIAGRIADLHKLGVYHGDLKWSNIILNPSTGHFWFTDLDSCLVRRGFNKSTLIAKDLVRFLVSARESQVEESITDEFLKKYAEASCIKLDQLRKQIEPRFRKLMNKKENRTFMHHPG